MSQSKRQGNIFRKTSTTDPQPMLADDYLILDNEKAKEKIPQEFASLKTRKLEVFSDTEMIEKFSRSENHKNVLEIELPAGANIGLPGIKAQRFAYADIQKSIQSTTSLEGNFPSWVDFTPHPKLSAAAKKIIRRPNGEIIEPFYGVFGTDDRQVYYPSGYPWICIGKIYAWSDFSQPYPQWSGSGVLIGGRIVLTAGHMVPWGSSNWAMQFIPAYYDGGSALGAGVSSWVSDAHGYSDPVSAWDMAVLRLYTPLGNSYGYFGAKTYSSSWQGLDAWTLAGYPGAIANANRPSRQMWWPMVDDDGSGNADELEYEADSTPGDSGGPLFGFWPNESWPSIIGTVSGGLKETFLWWTIEDTNVGAGGAAIVDLISWARSVWP